MAPPVHIPRIYRLMFLWFEPFAAFNGARIVVFNPIWYLQSLSPGATASTYSPLDQPIYDQLAAHLLRFAWCEAVLLRITDDIRVWKYLLFGILLCDVVHLYASYQSLGAAVFFDPRKWRMEEWVNFLMLYIPGALRIGVCLGIGIGSKEEAAKRESSVEAKKAT